MKKFILMTGAALLLAGCNQGADTDTYGTGGGADVNTNTYQTDVNQGAAGSVGGTNSATDAGANP